ncbi:hypothetical protein Tco_1579789 [Tanacetum coccineum]
MIRSWPGTVVLCKVIWLFGSLSRDYLCVVWRLSVRLPSSVDVAVCKCSSTGRPLGAYNLGVETLRALVYAVLMTSRDARLWYMINGDAKS